MLKIKILCSLFLLVLTCLGVASEQVKIDRIQILTIDSSINPATEDYIKTQYSKLNENDLVVIKMNTPGGLVSVTKEIITTIGSAKALTAIWVTPEGASATSAGAIISSAAHFLFMSPGTNIGAATPIGMGKDIDQKDARAKAINDLVAMVKSLSELRGRNSLPFEKMISDAQSYTDGEALKEKVIDSRANTIDEIKDYLQNQNVTIQGVNYSVLINDNVAVIEKEMKIGQVLLNILANPSTAYILFLIGVALIYFELQSPGGFIAGAVGTVFLILAGIAFQILPLNIGSLGLIILAFILFVLEIYVTSYGILSFAGMISLVIGSLFLFKTDNSYLYVNLQIIFSTIAAVLVVLAGVGFILWRDRKKNFQASFELIGHEGVVLTVLPNDRYQIKVFGEIWSALSDDRLQINDRVKVINKDLEKLHIYVKRI